MSGSPCMGARASGSWCHDALVAHSRHRPTDAVVLHLEAMPAVASNPSRTSRDVRRVRLAADAGESADRYVSRVERPSVAIPARQLANRFRRANLWALDAVLATFFVGVALAGHFGSSSAVDLHDPNAFSIFLTLAASVPYYFRRHAPLAVMLISEVAVVTLTVTEYETAAAPWVLLVGVYTVAAWCNDRERLIGAVALAIGLAIVTIVGIPGSSGADAAFNIVLYVAAYMFGTAVRNRRLYSEQLEDRADALERERDEEAQRAVADERLRIAQDLHDVVAHSMGVIAVQAGVGSHVIDSDPAEAKKALDAISHTSRTTLTEIRRMLGVLREDTGASYEPAPGLADLDKLVRDIGAA